MADLSSPTRSSSTSDRRPIQRRTSGLFWEVGGTLQTPSATRLRPRRSFDDATAGAARRAALVREDVRRFGDQVVHHRVVGSERPIWRDATGLNARSYWMISIVGLENPPNKPSARPRDPAPPLPTWIEGVYGRPPYPVGRTTVFVTTPDAGSNQAYPRREAVDAVRVARSSTEVG